MPCNMLAVSQGAIRNLDALFASEAALTYIREQLLDVLESPVTLWEDGTWQAGYRQWLVNVQPTRSLKRAARAKTFIDAVAEVGCIRFGRNQPISYRDGWRLGARHKDVADRLARAEEVINLANALATVEQVILESKFAGKVIGMTTEAVLGRTRIGDVGVTLAAGTDGSFMVAVDPSEAADYGDASAAIQKMMPSLNAYVVAGDIEQHAHPPQAIHQAIHQF